MFRKIRKNVKKLLVLTLIVFFVLGISQVIIKSKGVKLSSASTQTKSATQVNVGKTFDFTASVVGDKNIGKNTEKIKFTITSAELKDEIKVKNEPRKAPDAKAFLLVRLELNNETTRRLSFVSSDYIRLLGESDKKFSPDFHNGAVAIDPLSVKKDLISFMVDSSQKQFNLLVGELEKDKQKVEIHF